MNTRQIDELSIFSMLVRMNAMYKAKNSKAGVPLWKGLQLVPLPVYAKLNTHAQAVLNRVKSNIICGVYSPKDLRNYLILEYATGNPMGANSLPTGHEEICAVANALSDARFTIDKKVFKGLHQRFLTERSIKPDDKVPDVYYTTVDGTPSMMYRLMMASSVSPRFYLSGLNALTNEQHENTLGLLEKTYRRFVRYLVV